MQMEIISNFELILVNKICKELTFLIKLQKNINNYFLLLSPDCYLSNNKYFHCTTMLYTISSM